MKIRVGRVMYTAIATVLLVTGGEALAAPAVKTAPSSVSFGERTVGEEYSYRYVEVFGTGPEAVELELVELEGSDADQFTMDDWDCAGNEVDDEASCLLTVDFSPTGVGTKAADVRIDTSEGDQLVMPMTGTGVELAGNAPDLAAPALGPPLAGTDSLWGFAGADFQGEGRSGVISVSQMDGSSITSSFAFGQPSGLLTTPFGRDLASSGFAGDAAVGDFDGDGDIDAAGAGAGRIRAYMNDGTGGMSTGTELPVDPENGTDGRLAAGDFTGDEIEDVLSGYGTVDEETSEFGYMLQLFPGNEQGSFDPPISQQTMIDMPMAIASGEFNGDGDRDFAATAYDGNVYMYTGDGSGSFTQVGKFGPGCGCQSPWGVATGDLNGDGLDDVVATMRFENELAVYLAQSGGFVRGQRIEIPLVDGWDPNPYAVSIGDLNGDAKPDLVSGNYLNDSATVFIGRGDGTFALAEHLTPDPSGFYSHGTFIGDFNGDGKPDPSVAGQSGDVAIFLNQGEPGQVADPTSVDFGGVESGTESSPVTIRLENQGGLALLEVGHVSIGGGSSSDFKVTGGNCETKPVPVGDTCEVQVVFAPVGPAGERESTLYFTTNHQAESLVSVPLAGRADDPPIPVPGISIDPSSRDFGEVEAGSVSSPVMFVVHSAGGAPLDITGMTIEGAGGQEFKSLSNSCVGIFQPGATCSFSIRFEPDSAGAKIAEVRLASDAQNTPGAVALSGTGVAVPVVKAPKVIIKKRPKAKSRIRGKRLKQARVAFRSDQPGSRFQCRVDKKKLRACKSPLVLRNLKPGKHVVRIRASKAGRTGPVKVISFRVIRRR